MAHDETFKMKIIVETIIEAKMACFPDCDSIEEAIKLQQKYIDEGDIDLPDFINDTTIARVELVKEQ